MIWSLPERMKRQSVKVPPQSMAMRMQLVILHYGGLFRLVRCECRRVDILRNCRRVDICVVWLQG